MGACDCPGNEIVCGSICLDATSDVFNCGACGVVCPVGGDCIMGDCQCNFGTTECPDGCVNLLGDPNNCGQCGTICPLGGANTFSYCDAGACQIICDNGFADCDGAPGNGCEVSLYTDGANCGQCGHSCLGGACAFGACAVTEVSANISNPRDIVIDAASAYVIADGGIHKAPLAGGNPTLLVADNSLLTRMVLDNADLYFVSYTGGTISKVPVAGGAVSIVYSGEQSPWGIDKQGTLLAWATSGAQDYIRTAVLPGMPSNLGALTGTSSEVVINGDTIFFTDLQLNADEVRSVPIAGGPVTTLATTQFSSLNGDFGLVADATHVYWATGVAGMTWGYVARVPRQGGPIELLATNQDAPRDLQLDGPYVYFTVGGSGGSVLDPKGAIRRVPRAGGPVLNLAIKQLNPRRIAVGMTHVYWTDGSYGKIFAAPK